MRPREWTRRTWVLNCVTVLLFALLGWLLLWAPSFTFASNAGTFRCQPIIGSVDSYGLTGISFDRDVVYYELRGFYDRAREWVPYDQANETRDVDAVNWHAEDVAIMACQDARTNRQTEANLVMLALAVLMIPRLSRLRDWEHGRNRTETRRATATRSSGPQEEQPEREGVDDVR